MTELDIEARIQDLVDGKLAPDERAALLAEINRDPALLDLYWDYVVLECAFARLFRSGVSLQTGPAVTAGTALRERGKRHPGRGYLAVAAVLLMLVAVSVHQISTSKEPPGATFRLSPNSVFNVSNAMGEPLPGTLIPGSRAKLVQGTVELNFASGVRAIVMGPADLTLHEGGNLFMQSGTGWFRVPAKAAGFKVLTPVITLADFGTTFGVIARNDRPPEAHVLEGKVVVQTHGQVPTTETLGRGMARAVDSLGQMTKIPPAPERFLTTLPTSLPHLHWSFDDDPQSTTAGGNLPAAGSKAGRFAGLENTKAFQMTEGRFGNALATTGVHAQARSDWSGVEGTAPRTIAHWVKPKPGGPPAQQIVGWGSHALSPFNPNPAFLTYLRRIKIGTVAGVSFGSYYLDGTTPLADDRWHHFAVVYTGRELPDGRPELFCYLDGRAEPMTPSYRTDIGSPNAPGAHATATSVSARDSIPVTLFPGKWVGDGRSANMSLALDELYYFEAALDETQVMNLYQKNRIQ